MIRDTSGTTNKPGEKTFGNAIDAELDSLMKSRAFAVKQQEKTGQDVSELLALYDEQIARLKGMR
jgi:hypothetical protein